MSWRRMKKQDFVLEARRAAARYRLQGRVAREDEEVSFNAYVYTVGFWGGEKRLVLLVMDRSGNVYTVIAPPVPNPLCVAISDASISTMVKEVLRELGSRYVSWCVVIYPPAFTPRSLLEALEVLIQLEILDELA